MWFCSSCNGITHHCFLSIFDGLDFMFGEKHWNRGAIKYLNTFGMIEMIC